MNVILPKPHEINADDRARLETWQRFYRVLHQRTCFDWPLEWHHPYAFQWGSDLQRDKVVNCLCLNKDGQTDLPTAQVLRYLLFLFRVAQYRRREKLGDWFDRHRWRWATNAEAMADTGLSERQLRRAVAILEERGLVRVVRDYKLGNVPHYRPSADLFRLCVYMCRYWNSEFFDGWIIASAGDGMTVTASDALARDKELKHCGSRLFAKHFPEVQAIIGVFAVSKDADRFYRLTEDWFAVEKVAMQGD